jgi:hypothetical protein
MKKNYKFVLPTLGSLFGFVGVLFMLTYSIFNNDYYLLIFSIIGLLMIIGSLIHILSSEKITDGFHELEKAIHEYNEHIETKNKMNKIIFLDIDGVLNVIPRDVDKYGQIFHEHFTDNLRLIINETGADIVISSTWKMSGLEVMINMWNDRGLPGKVVGITKTVDELINLGIAPFYDLVSRGDEIELYIKENNISKYCIIDDNDDFLEHQMEYVVNTSDNHSHPDSIKGYGLTEICRNKVIEILNKN